jgi:hypothetical protein
MNIIIKHDEFERFHNMIVHRRKQANMGRQRPTLDDKGSMSCQSLVAPSTASRHYDNLYSKKRSRCCTKDKTFGGDLCSMDLVVVFHPPQPGGRIQADKLVSSRKDPPSGGRACASLHGKVCVRPSDRPPEVAYYAQTTGGSAGVPGGTVHFGKLLAMLFRRHHHARASPARLCHMPKHGVRPW